MRKVVCFIFICFFFLSCEETKSRIIVDFPDPLFKRAVKQILKNPGNTIYDTDLTEIKLLVLFNKKIKDLTVV